MAFMPTGEVVIEGILFKKTPAGFRGFKPWQKRYFMVTTKVISYHKEKGEEPKGVIPILEVKKVEYLPDKRMGARFDVSSKNGRTYCLHSDCEEDSRIWVNAIRQAVMLAKTTTDDEEKQTSILEGNAKRYSTLQQVFFDAKFGKESMTRRKGYEKDAKMIMLEIERDFATDVAILKYILTKVLHPTAGLFTLPDPAAEMGEINLGSPVSRLLTRVGTQLNVSCEGFNKAFAYEGIFTILELVDGTIPASVPKKVAQKIAVAVEELQAKAKETDLIKKASLPQACSATTTLERIAALLCEPALVRNLVLVFSQASEEAHGFAVRVLWGIYHATMPSYKAISEFTSQIDIQCAGGRLSLATKDALMAILLSGHEVVSSLEPIGNIIFYMKVKHATAWSSLFASLKESDFEIRKLALADVNALLHDNLSNCELLVDGNNWQTWVYPLFTDIRKEDKAKDPIKTVFAFLVNALTLVHFQFFIQSPRFKEVINNSLWRMHQYGGSNRECQQITSTLLGALVSKLTSQKTKFSTDYESQAWLNFLVLLECLRKYVFQSAFWQSVPYLGLVFDAAVEEDDGKEEQWQEISPAALAAGAGYHGSNDPPDPPATSAFMGASTMSGHSFIEAEAVLAQHRPSKHERTWASEPGEIKDYGVHWTPVEDGRAVDVDLCKKVHHLFKALRVDTFDQELAVVEGIEKVEAEFLKKCAAEASFWEDAAKFLSMMKRENIAVQKLFTYRRLSFLCQSFLGSDSHNGRERLMQQLTRLMAGETVEPEPQHCQFGRLGKF